MPAAWPSHTGAWMLGERHKPSYPFCKAPKLPSTHHPQGPSLLTSSHLMKRSPWVRYAFTAGGNRTGLSSDMSSVPLWRGWANTSRQQGRKEGEQEGKLDWAHMAPAQHWSGSQPALIACRVAVAACRTQSLRQGSGRSAL